MEGAMVQRDGRDKSGMPSNCSLCVPLGSSGKFCDAPSQCGIAVTAQCVVVYGETLGCAKPRVVKRLIVVRTIRIGSRRRRSYIAPLPLPPLTVHCPASFARRCYTSLSRSFCMLTDATMHSHAFIIVCVWNCVYQTDEPGTL